MKRAIVAVVVCLLAGVGIAHAQEHWTEGPVWECSAYRTQPGQFNNYMKYLRKHFAGIEADAKAEGLMVDSKIFVKTPATPQDWDVMFCTAYENGSDALDYDAEAEKKWEAILAKHTGSEDQEKQEEMMQPRFEMRQFLGTTMMREVTLKPME